MHAIAPLLLAFATLAAAQEPADPMRSGECRSARDELDTALKEPDAANRSRQLKQARLRVARACLGAKGQPQGARSGAPDPVRVVPPPRITGAAPPPAATPPPAAVTIQRPAVITTCDPAGCWDSEGRRLNSMGPALVGPTGVCSVQGGVVNCP